MGEYFADLIVDDIIILELKASETLCEEHEEQLLEKFIQMKIKNPR